jgi:hypothetical protein
MRLTRVTITGADDQVPHQALVDLSAEYPFVEWGILMSSKRFGEPRYPRADWLLGLSDTHLVERCSYHVCGALARRVMCGDPTMVPREIKRMQINGFAGYRLPGLFAAELCPELEFILQCNTDASLRHAVELRMQCPGNVVALWDCSGGAGAAFENDWFPLARDYKIPIGYAGGITEDNIEDTIAMLCTGTGDPLWIDLESGARTDDKFDVAKVRRILELSAPFVVST